MTKTNGPLTALTVGQVAEQFDVTVRTLHHYDEIGLLVPSGRTSAGYRLYDGEDITRVQHVVVYRRLGFALEQIALLLDDPSADLVEPATSERAMDAAEQARLHIHTRFYDLTPEFHRNLGDMYLADPRFTKTYEDIKPGMAQYVRDAIHANADRAAAVARATDRQS